MQSIIDYEVNQLYDLLFVHDLLIVVVDCCLVRLLIYHRFQYDISMPIDLDGQNEL